jgi:glutaminase
VHSSTADYDSRTALHLAASNGNISIVDKLLRIEGIEVNSVDRVGGTPLEDAYRHNQTVVAQMLTQAGGLRKGDPTLDTVVTQQCEF